jgi:beta-lactamase regulating signal transducer with metallopeptidase domain
MSEVAGWGWFIQGTLCLALGLIGSLLFRRHAALAHQVLRLGMLAALLVPLLSLVVQRQDLGWLPPKSEPVRSTVQSETPVLPVLTPLLMTDATLAMPVSPPREDPVSTAPPAPSEPKSTAAAAPIPRPFPWRQIALAGWLAVGLGFLFRLVRTVVWGWRLLRGAAPCEQPVLLRAAQQARTQLSVCENVTIRESAAVKSPVIWCWGSRPVLLVQRDIEPCQETDWVGIFCHELAHWKRRDHLTGLWADVWRCVFWWHPLVWWTRQRLDTLSEQACDDWVLATGQSGPDYAQSLLGLAPVAAFAFLPHVVGKEKTMKERIIRIIKHRSGNPRVGRSWALALILLTSLLIVGTAFAQRRAPRPERDLPERREGGAVMDRRGELGRAMEEVEIEIRGARQRLQALAAQGESDSTEARELREAIGHLERRMLELRREMEVQERRGQQRREAGPREEVAAYREKIIRQMEAIRMELDEAVHALHQLEEEGRGDSNEARRRRMGIEKLERTLPRFEQQLQALERRGEQRMQAEQREARGRELEMHRRELLQRKEELKGLGDEHPERGRIQGELEDIQRQLERIEQARRELQGPGPRPRPEAGPDDLRRRHAALQEKAEGIQHAMEVMGDRNPELRERLEREWHGLRAEMEEIERLAHREKRPDAGRLDLEVQVRQLHERVEDLGHEMREIRGLLERLIVQRERSMEVEEEDVERRVRGRERRVRSERDEQEGDHMDLDHEEDDD